MPKLLFLSGSTRKESLNKKLAQLACDKARSAGAEATLIDLQDFEMPMYQGDLEDRDGIPEAAKALRQVFADHDGFFIATPEYNSSMPPVLINALDWITRPQENVAPLIAFRGKVAALGAVSPGGLGGLRVLVPLRMMLGNIAVHVIPTQVAVSNGMDAFDENGGLKNEMQAGLLQMAVDEFASTAEKLRSK